MKWFARGFRAQSRKNARAGEKALMGWPAGNLAIGGLP